MTNPHDNLLDAWNDFSKIKHILSDIHESIVIILGASWCHKCDPIKTTVLHMTKQDTPGIHWLWLDIEDHCEFLGDYYPDTIPLAWVYQGEHLIRHGLLEDKGGSNLQFLDFIHSIPIAEKNATRTHIRSFLLAENNIA